MELIEMGRGTETQLHLPRHSHPLFSVHITLSVPCTLLSSPSMAQGTTNSTNNKAPALRAAAQLQEHLPRFGVPQTGLRQFLVFLRGLACQSRASPEEKFTSSDIRVYAFKKAAHGVNVIFVLCHLPESYWIGVITIYP